MILMMFRKSVKSIQNSLNETRKELKESHTVTASAYSQAREKLKHTAFIELNDMARDEFSKRKDLKKLKGFRVVGVDGSQIAVPKTEKTIKEFGLNRSGNKISTYEDMVNPRIMVLYDVLNNMEINSKLSHISKGERTVFKEQIKYLQKGDLAIFDRGFPSYELYGILEREKIDFVMRLRKTDFPKEYAELIENIELKEKIVKAEMKRPDKIKDKNIKKTLTLRLVKVELDNGEIEILVTSVLSKKKFKAEEFKELYWLRWGIETYFDIIKNRLDIGNFTGKSVESIYQDFFATIFISNLETALVKDTNVKLEERSKNNKNKQKVNHSVAFNEIKNRVFEIFYNSSNKSEKRIKEDLEKVFLLSPSQDRNREIVKRKKTKTRKSLYYQKFVKKSVF